MNVQHLTMWKLAQENEFPLNCHLKKVKHTHYDTLQFLSIIKGSQWTHHQHHHHHQEQHMLMSIQFDLGPKLGHFILYSLKRSTNQKSFFPLIFFSLAKGL